MAWLKNGLGRKNEPVESSEMENVLRELRMAFEQGSCAAVPSGDLELLLQARVVQLEQASRDLAARERAVKEAESRLRAEKERLQQSWQRLREQERGLEGKCKVLREQSSAQGQREAVFRSREAALAEQDRRLAAAREELRVREEAVSAVQVREADLERREAELQRRSGALGEASARYERERALWEQFRASAGAAAQPPVEEGLQEVRTQFMDIAADLKLVQGSLRSLMAAVDRSGRDGVAQLCALYRDMSFSEDEAVRRTADRLGMILQCDFEAQPIEPRPGELYDSVCSERRDTACRGARVTCCMARGWRWKDEILLRAVVDTTERDE